MEVAEIGIEIEVGIEVEIEEKVGIILEIKTGIKEIDLKNVVKKRVLGINHREDPDQEVKTGTTITDTKNHQKNRIKGFIQDLEQDRDRRLPENQILEYHHRIEDEKIQGLTQENSAAGKINQNGIILDRDREHRLNAKSMIKRVSIGEIIIIIREAGVAVEVPRIIRIERRIPERMLRIN